MLLLKKNDKEGSTSKNILNQKGQGSPDLERKRKEEAEEAGQTRRQLWAPRPRGRWEDAGRASHPKTSPRGAAASNPPGPASAGQAALGSNANSPSLRLLQQFLPPKSTSPTQKNVSIRSDI